MHSDPTAKLSFEGQFRRLQPYQMWSASKLVDRALVNSDNPDTGFTITRLGGILNCLGCTENCFAGPAA